MMKEINIMILHLEKEEQFNELVNEGNVIVDFYADWCGPCKMIAREFELIEKTNPEVKILKVNVDNHGKIAAKYSIRSIPTIMLFKEGQPAGVNVGYMTKNQILALANK